LVGGDFFLGSRRGGGGRVVTVYSVIADKNG